MSLTSYRAAPPRATNMSDMEIGPQVRKADRPSEPMRGEPRQQRCRRRLRHQEQHHEWVLKIRASIALAAMPGDDLLFHRLSDSTIGAVWFHGRVRDGIGWVTDAMATKQWGQRVEYGSEIDADHMPSLFIRHHRQRVQHCR